MDILLLKSSVGHCILYFDISQLYLAVDINSYGRKSANEMIKIFRSKILDLATTFHLFRIIEVFIFLIGKFKRKLINKNVC